MSTFLIILFVSLLVATVFVFFAFFPIKITWFYTNDPRVQRTIRIPAPPPPPPPSYVPKPPKYNFSPEYRAYRLQEKDNFDDPEL